MDKTSYIWFLSLLCGVFSHKEYIAEPIGNGYDLKTPYQEHHEYKTDPYEFGYEIKDGKGNAHFHKEKSDEYNYKKGSYGYTDAYGIYRHVDYIADHEGFRAKIRTNEPGVENKDPADVHIYAEPPPYQLQALYAKTKYPEQVYTQQHQKYDYPPYHLQQEYDQGKKYPLEIPTQYFQQKNYAKKEYTPQIGPFLQQEYHQEKEYDSKIHEYPIQQEKKYTPKIQSLHLQQQFYEEKGHPSKLPIQQQQYHEESVYPQKTLVEHYQQQQHEKKGHYLKKGEDYKKERNTWVPIYSPPKSKYASYDH